MKIVRNDQVMREATTFYGYQIILTNNHKSASSGIGN